MGVYGPCGLARSTWIDTGVDSDICAVEFIAAAQTKIIASFGMVMILTLLEVVFECQLNVTRWDGCRSTVQQDEALMVELGALKLVVFGRLKTRRGTTAQILAAKQSF